MSNPGTMRKYPGLQAKGPYERSLPLSDMAFFLSGGAHVEYGAVLIIALAAYGAVAARQSTGLLLAFVLTAIIAAGIFVDVWVHGYRH